MNARLQLTLFSALLFAACSKDAHPPGTHVHADGTVHQDGPADAHEGGAEHPLGEVTLGGVKAQIVQLGDVEAGKEAHIDVRFAAGTKRPETLRGWIGVESAQGSMKALFVNEGETGMHGHVEAPKPIAEGSKLWLEVEAAGAASKASVALHK